MADEPQEPDKRGEPERPSGNRTIGAGLAIGIATGAAIGIATDDIAMWIPVGMVLGIAIGAGRSRGAGGGEPDRRGGDG